LVREKMLSRVFRWHTLALIALYSTACGGAAQSESNERESGDDATGGTGSGATTPVDVECIAGTMLFEEPPEVDVLGRHLGTNGTFVDTCDGGNLVEYRCVVRYSTPTPMASESWPYRTGEVMSLPVDCGGRCRNGVCPNICPSVGADVSYLSIGEGGVPVLLDASTGVEYACEGVSFGPLSNGYDCRAAPRIGDVMQVTDLSGDCGNVVNLSVGTGTTTLCGYQVCTAMPR
jgi:hypothetical protein